MPDAEVHLGPARYFQPVCVRTPLGFMGGPSDYREVAETDREGWITVEPREDSDEL